MAWFKRRFELSGSVQHLQQKLNGDATDFRAVAEAFTHRSANCLLCHPPASELIAENALAVARPVAGHAGHFQIVSRRHGASYFGLFQPELNALRTLELTLVEGASALGVDGRTASISIAVQGVEEYCVVRCISNTRVQGGAND